MQNYKAKPLIPAGALTTSYVESEVLGYEDELTLQSNNQVVLYVYLTLGSLTSAEIKVEFSHDKKNFVQDTFLSISGGVAVASLGEYTMTEDGNYRIAIPVKDKYLKVSAKGTGTVTGSSLEIEAITGVA